ncbi:hypothetical protein QUB37_29275, partial [Microcoleus sp. AT3-A2]|uniref:hypothetical protein n=1 Tax=Microcoleus sp. AT3-A2 TaxID=2818610 RepID=UPI002FD32E52
TWAIAKTRKSESCTWAIAKTRKSESSVGVTTRANAKSKNTSEKSNSANTTDTRRYSQARANRF